MLSQFEKGFAQYNQAIEEAKKYGGNRPPAILTRKVNDAIRMMASEDYECMTKIVKNKWLIGCALKDWKPCENGIAWRKAN